MEDPTRHPALQAFKRRAEAALPGRIAHMVLFGSRARGDAEAESDWDVAVFLEGEVGWAEQKLLSRAAHDVLLEDEGPFIQPLALAAGREGEARGLLQAIRAEGRAP